MSSTLSRVFIKNIVSNILNAKSYNQKPINCDIIVDTSGSTGSSFKQNYTILEKEMSIAMEYILANPLNTYRLFGFSNTCDVYSISVMKNEDFVNLPEFESRGGTRTHVAFAKINEQQTQPSLVILLTDGQTDSSNYEIKNEIDKFISKKISLEVIAVSYSDIDMNTISQSEENKIPGMELLTYLKNSVDKLTIYNKVHDDQPYIGAISSAIDKRNLSFLGITFTCLIPDFLEKLMVELINNKGKFDWGINNIQFKRFVSEIGKLFSALFVTFPENHYFIDKMIDTIVDTCEITNMTKERISHIIKYGFECAKNKKPILYTNFETHIKERAVKHAEFADAISKLNSQGTTLDSSKSISIPHNGLCIINHDGAIPLIYSLNMYKNSMDNFGNVYFGCDSNEQAIRIGLREFCSTIGYRDSRNSTAVIFHIASQMSLMYIKGADLQCEHMKELRKLAIIQTSMENLIAKGIYSGIGYFKQWEQGKSVPISYNTTLTHSSLYHDAMINPLGLNEPIWWALMMSMLGIFDKQQNYYDTALQQINVSTEEEFLSYITKEYYDKVDGKVEFLTYVKIPNSIFTLEEFSQSDKVYKLESHGNCRTNTCYSKQEITDYVLQHGCVWCHFIPTMENFIEMNFKNNEQEIQQKLITVVPVKSKLSPQISAPVIASSVPVFNVPNCTMYRINMIGLTGSGKSTSSEKIKQYIEEKNGKCLIVNSDYYSKRGQSGRAQANLIQKSIIDFERQPGNFKVIVIDICNESGPSPKCFNHDFIGYKTVNFMPNLDAKQYDNYEAWCLRNVIMRPNHTNECNYWLNPVSAGINVCIKVHNGKNQKLRQFLKIQGMFIPYSETMTLEQIQSNIKIRADTYEKFLLTCSLDTEIKNFVDNLK
ncbi:putative P-loop ATPase/GTPase domain-containing protein [Bodo saltans virus]|uniref:P-loop ATPase/GTPase domain-containing protein n=1 Tax=Bodo saltans virus TaxID=2024608 RepID=A0A2H4UVW1_9VIRU|nr:putative P-loop ATPase/GTPase domain-containing protein [Bodo saltans virus]ATZ81061.1 putative P-loop ATPase/GTPase domain-containing protein [Bodo saltans virus]